MKVLKLADNTELDAAITSSASSLTFVCSDFEGVDTLLTMLTHENLSKGFLDGMPFYSKVVDTVSAVKTSEGVIMTATLKNVSATGEIMDGITGGTVPEDAKDIVELAQKGRDSLTDEEALDYTGYFNAWDPDGHNYTVGDRIQYGGKLYKVLQAHTSQADWAPDAAASLFAQILPGQDGTEIGEWVQPDSTNPYAKGDKVKHNGYIWTSLVDSNVWEPSDSMPTLWEKGEAVSD